MSRSSTLFWAMLLAIWMLKRCRCRPESLKALVATREVVCPSCEQPHANGERGHPTIEILYLPVSNHFARIIEAATEPHHRQQQQPEF